MHLKLRFESVTLTGPKLGAKIHLKLSVRSGLKTGKRLGV